MTRHHPQTQYIRDITPTRRQILKGGLMGIGGAAITTHAFAYQNQTGENKSAIPQPSQQNPEFLFAEDGKPSASDPLWGMAMAYGENRLDLIDLDGSQILHSFKSFDASHAVIPIEATNRFVIHGYRQTTKSGAIMVLEVDPITKNWSVLMDQDLRGGRLLHWQPRPDLSEIVFNTIGDGGLHVLDTKTLNLSSYRGGGRHSNCLLYTSPSPRDQRGSRMPSSA